MGPSMDGCGMMCNGVKTMVRYERAGWFLVVALMAVGVTVLLMFEISDGGGRAVPVMVMFNAGNDGDGRRDGSAMVVVVVVVVVISGDGLAVFF